jgi:hypothetical protein
MNSAAEGSNYLLTTATILRILLKTMAEVRVVYACLPSVAAGPGRGET